MIFHHYDSSSAANLSLRQIRTHPYSRIDTDYPVDIGCVHRGDVFEVITCVNEMRHDPQNPSVGKLPIAMLDQMLDNLAMPPSCCDIYRRHAVVSYTVRNCPLGAGQFDNL